MIVNNYVCLLDLPPDDEDIPVKLDPYSNPNEYGEASVFDYNTAPGLAGLFGAVPGLPPEIDEPLPFFIALLSSLMLIIYLDELFPNPISEIALFY